MSSLNFEDKALVSVAMCTYNGELYLEEQLLSVLQQDYKPIELVICDDCSTDSTWEILKNYQDQYPDIIRCFRNESNLGYNKNFEKAISKCKGEYIAIADQDDVWELDKLSSLVPLLNDSGNMLAHSASVNFSKLGPSFR